ncbi:hypothetical protein G4B88_009916 [Cannabis sativa]|uniref:Retrotransposon Copia-like N-terminal domain-containing protein n=1 Tax=Cannabis sativa TaxID=3483 RepID=A0A7J6DKL7_CANSA|nr:hypothetical protein G4B88_009916 [Cannabis sativa]
MQEASSAKYIVQQYLAAIGGLGPLNSINNMYVVGQVKMMGSEMKVGDDSVQPKGKSEVGGFVLWQKNPDLWYLELVVSGFKVSAGSDGKVAWNQSSSQPSHANKGPPRPLRRFFQPFYFSNLVLEHTKPYVSAMAENTQSPAQSNQASTGNNGVGGQTAGVQSQVTQSQTPNMLIRQVGSTLTQSFALKLDKNNYFLWKTMVSAIVRGHRLDGYRTGGRSKPDEFLPTETEAARPSTSWQELHDILLSFDSKVERLRAISGTNKTTVGNLTPSPSASLATTRPSGFQVSFSSSQQQDNPKFNQYSERETPSYTRAGNEHSDQSLEESPIGHDQAVVEL